jgi:outer membrane protein TolC
MPQAVLRLRRAVSPIIAVCGLLFSGAFGLQAQQAPAADTTAVSFNTAVDLALRNSSKVLAAQASMQKAEGALTLVHDVYIPSLVGGSSVGPPPYGFPAGTPSLFNFTIQSVVFDYSQRDYIRSARAGLQASQLSLKDARQQIIEDAAYTYIQLDTALQQQQALDGQYAAAARLDEIVVQRESAGLESHIDVLKAELVQQQIRLKQLHGRNNITSLRDHLARLTGLPATTIATNTASIPSTPEVPPALDAIPESAAIQAAYAQAHAAQETAFGDARQMWRPQISFAAQYARFASFSGLENYYQNLQANNFSAGVQITMPFFDAVRSARAKQSAAEAVRARHEADYLRDQAAEGDLKMLNSLQEVSAKQTIARLQSEISIELLKTVRMQLQNGSNVRSAQTPQLSPVDEQNASIDERGKFIDLLDSQLELTHLQLDLLRASGGLEGWAQSSTHTVTTSK